MTDLYTISVDMVEGATCRGRVHIINPDSLFVPTGRTFPVSLIFETWFPEDVEAPGAAELGDEDPLVTAQRPELEPMIYCRRQIRIDEDGYLLSYDGQTLLEARRHAKDVPGESHGSGRDEVSAYISVDVPQEHLIQRAPSIVTSYEVSPLRNVPLRGEVLRFNDGDPLSAEESAEIEESFEGVELDEEELMYDGWKLIMDRPFEERPYADITFTVTEARYLKHLTPGLRWRTAVWR